MKIFNVYIVSYILGYVKFIEYAYNKSWKTSLYMSEIYNIWKNYNMVLTNNIIRRIIYYRKQ